MKTSKYKNCKCDADFSEQRQVCTKCGESSFLTEAASRDGNRTEILEAQPDVEPVESASDEPSSQHTDFVSETKATRAQVEALERSIKNSVWDGEKYVEVVRF